MNKLTPYIFPLVVIIIVFFLVYRWYGMSTNRPTTADQYGEGIQIEDLSTEQASSLLRGSADLETAPLTSPETTEPNTTTGTGSIRYEVVEGKVNFSVIAELPEIKRNYEVWIRTVGGDNLTNAATMVSGKGGYTATISVSDEQLPLEVLVSQAKDKAEVLGSVVLQGTIAAPTDEQQGQE